MSTRRALLLAGFVGLVMACLLIVWQRGSARRSSPEQAAAPSAVVTHTDADAANRASPDGVRPTPASSDDAPRAVAPPVSTLVDLHDLAPDVRIDLRYAGRGNFLRETLYPANRCLLQRVTAERIARVQAKLDSAGLVLVVWDCYRPLSVQRRMWKIVKDPRYVADPQEGSKHNRGAAVDVSLATARGAALEMGTDHDDFSERAHRDFADLPAEAIQHRKALEQVMKNEGFLPLATEWWHFDDPDWADYPLLDEAIDASRP